MNKTAIEYLTHTWNPIVMRCTPIGEGCTNCWHLRTANRLANNPKILPDLRASYAGDREPLLVGERLHEPLYRKKPARIGVQFMGDLFHEDIDTRVIKRDVWNVMVDCPQHIFVVLTKRPQRMLECYEGHIPWPDNIWLGVTAENQKRADERIPILLQTPAAVKFVSVEPMLGPIHLKHWLGWWNSESEPAPEGQHGYPGDISWVILGVETGPGARPMCPDWARGVRDQCVNAGVRFFYKRGETGRLLDGREWNEYPR